MRIVIDTPHVESRLRLARTLSLVGVLILGAGLVVNLFALQQVESLGIDPMVLSLGFLAVGVVISQVALYFANRYGARYRPDEVIDTALHGLDDRYVVFHHVKGLPAHVLLSPSGAWLLETRHQTGRIAWENGRWRHDMPLKFLRSWFGDGLGNPARDAEMGLEELKKTLHKAELDNLPSRAVVVFVDPGARVEAEGAPVPAVHAAKLKGYVRQVDQAAANPVSRTTINQAAQALGRGLAETQASAAEEPAETVAVPRSSAARKRRRSKGKGQGS
jgi:hypothetical protein